MFWTCPARRETRPWVQLSGSAPKVLSRDLPDTGHDRVDLLAIHKQFADVITAKELVHVVEVAAVAGRNRRRRVGDELLDQCADEDKFFEEGAARGATPRSELGFQANECAPRDSNPKPAD
jgi:hypothetical protein